MNTFLSYPDLRAFWLITARFQASRVPGSGAVSQNDLAYAWDDLLASRVRDMVLKQNLRVGGRGLVDAREVLHQPNLLKSPHGSALSKQGSSQVTFCSHA